MTDIERKERDMHIQVSTNWDVFTFEHVQELIRSKEPPAIGYLVWTRMNHGEKEVREYIEALRARHITHLRTGFSWTEWLIPDGKDWIRWYMREYAKHFTVLPCFTFTPPELALEPRVNAPPKDVTLYAKFVDEVLLEFGEFFETVELWNEWNLNTDWDPELDPEYDAFIAMVNLAARAARSHGKRVVLGGPSKVNEDSLRTVARFAEHGLPQVVDVLGFHNLRGTWSDHSPPPPIGMQARLLKRAWGNNAPVWLTEYGFPVADPENRFDLENLEAIQVSLFAHMVYTCLTGEIERAYWYTYRDEVHPSLRFVTTGWEDVLQFYFGDTEELGRPRLLARLLCEGGPVHVLEHAAKENLMPLIEKASLGRKLPE